MATRTIGALALGAAAICGCGHATAGQAATGAALAIGATAVYRATTGGCWAQCRQGLVCDPGSGMCIERPPCRGECAIDERCERSIDTCVPILWPTSTVAVGVGSTDLDASSGDP